MNPPVSSVTPAEPSPSAIDMVNPALKPSGGHPPKVEVADPTRRSTVEATAPQDWTIHRQMPEKVDNPPPKPISQVLLDHLKTVWTAGASAIQIEQVKNQLTPPQPLNPTDAPGLLAKEVLVYTPSKIKKTEDL
ncbi:MAG: hypothetical protein U5M53_08175 [Rhodoferax sp.]|nr:hypothetical protein [Rhodoferax sp.]